MITVKMSGQQLDESIFDGCDQGHCAGHHITVVLPVSSSASLPDQINDHIWDCKNKIC